MRFCGAFLVLLLSVPHPALAQGPAGERARGVGASSTASLELRVDAPAALDAAAARVRAIERGSLEASLARAGLAVPDAIDIELIPEADPRARQTASWVVGRAFGTRLVWIFPQRVTSYPYDSTESVVRHEVVHIALASSAGGAALPRWFHEGVAVSVDAGWGIRSSLRLLLTAADRSRISDLENLFASERQADATEAYLLAAVLVDDLRQRHGAALPGAIARRVAVGAAFDSAFLAETGETADAAAARAWAGYRRWSRWLPLLTDPSAVWTLILLLSFAAFFVRLLRRARHWREEDDEENDGWRLGNDDSPD